MQVTEPRALIFQKSYYICDKCHEDLLVGWKGNICIICQGNFCHNLECIDTIDVPSKGTVFVCRYCCSVGEDILFHLADVESERLETLRRWKELSPSPALKKETV